METSRELDQEKPLERRQIPPALPVPVPKDIHTVKGATSKTSTEPGTLPNLEQEGTVILPQLDLSEVAQESIPDALADNRLEENATNAKPEDAIPSLPTLPSTNDTKEDISEDSPVRENPTLEETSEEPPAKENPTNNNQVANTEDEDGQIDSIEEATNSAQSPDDLAKDKCSEDSNLDDSSTLSEELTKSQIKSRKKRAKILAKQEEGDRLLMEEAIQTPLKDKDESEENHHPDQDHPEVPVRLAPLFIATPAKATKASTRISKIARKKSSPKKSSPKKNK